MDDGYKRLHMSYHTLNFVILKWAAEVIWVHKDVDSWIHEGNVDGHQLCEQTQNSKTFGNILFCDLTCTRSNKKPCIEHRSNVMEDVKERRLVLLFPQHKENCLNKFEDSQIEEKPGSNLNFQLHIVTKKLKPFALEDVLEGKSKSVCLNDVRAANDHLENVVNSNQIRHIIWFTFFHKIWSGGKNKPQINADYK